MTEKDLLEPTQAAALHVRTVRRTLDLCAAGVTLKALKLGRRVAHVNLQPLLGREQHAAHELDRAQHQSQKRALRLCLTLTNG